MADFVKGFSSFIVLCSFLFYDIQLTESVSNKYSIIFQTVEDCKRIIAPVDNSEEEFLYDGSEHKLPDHTRRTTTHRYYFNAARHQCLPCLQDSTIQTITADGLSCKCKSGYRSNQSIGIDIICEPCPSGKVASLDGMECTDCIKSDGNCSPCLNSLQIVSEHSIIGSRHQSISGSQPNLNDGPSRLCKTCKKNFQPDATKQHCVYCGQIAGSESHEIQDGQCRRYKFEDSMQVYANKRSLTSVRYGDESIDSDYIAKYGPDAILACDVIKNRTACQLLTNLCSLTLYNKGWPGSLSICSTYLVMLYGENATVFVDGRLMTRQNKAQELKDVLPEIYYQTSSEKVLTGTLMSTRHQFNENNRLQLTVARYSLGGEFLGFKRADGGTLQLCKNTNKFLDSAFDFGAYYNHGCSLRVRDFWDEKKNPTLLYELYYEDRDENGNLRLINVPVAISTDERRVTGDDIFNLTLVKRFFLVDNVLGKPDASGSSHARMVRYLKDMKLIVRLQTNENGAVVKDGVFIYPPLLVAHYSTAHWKDFEADRYVKVSSEFKYHLDLSNIFGEDQSAFVYAFLIMVVVVMIFTAIQTLSWSRKTSRIIGFPFLLSKFILFSFGRLADGIFYVLFVASLLWFLSFKLRNSFLLFAALDPIESSVFYKVVWVAFVLKTLAIYHMIICQVTINIFFIDWERPIFTGSQSSKDVSMWRLYSVVNMWMKLQTMRKVRPAFQMMLTVVILNGFAENFTSYDPYLNPRPPKMGEYRSPSHPWFRFFCFCATYIFLAGVQMMFNLLLDRCKANKLWSFVDICSLSNISVFILETEQYGYYIHGRNTNCFADIDMKHMHQNLLREEILRRQKRGLVPKTSCQIFEICIPPKMKSHYDRILLPILDQPHLGKEIGERLLTENLAKKTVVLLPEIERTVHAYSLMNRLLQAFIEHQIKEVDYIVLKRTISESILKLDSRIPYRIGYFYEDNKGNSFHSTLFCGHEWSLLIFEMLFFAFVDDFTNNFVYTGIIVYLLTKVFVTQVREVLGRINVAKKTLTDKRLFI